MGATCFAEFEALVVAMGGARLSASGVDVVIGVIATVCGVDTTSEATTVGGVAIVGVIATVCEVDTTDGATTVGVGRVGMVGGV
jgi:hypothetical protein